MRIAVLALLLVDSAALAAAELMFQPLYIGAVSAPVGALVAAVTLPWLVRRAAEVDTAPAVAGSPVLVWLLVIGVLGLAGPGGDLLLPGTWQSLLLVIVGLAAGLLAWRRTLELHYARGPKRLSAPPGSRRG
ncbi:hypothetical protein [Pseudonocardia asaccharolytica]|uniref:Integral membrane protein n=1 Tax=Pseudonocardia asaccharolytica DSM 44247 = NBRC 16224 TaxID=1123024 RepID=A0A511D1A0_9PSEU|nr:hypothetical protein [Pseudonocardia asaccharolytica]GEL18566.1 hypothetical protein PA7_24030 [Pseudonocardia asaccharolytica DSM 44247 = NBRC 16224]